MIHKLAGHDAMSGSKEGSPGLRLKYTQLQRHQTPVPATQHALIQDAVASHIESFDVMIAQSLPLSVRSLHPAHFRTDDKMVSFRMTDVVIHRPVVSSKNTSASDRAMYPAECRESRVSYKGDLSCTIKIDVEGVPTPWEIRRTLGQVPIMVKSSRCHLQGMTPKDLIRRHEEGQEMGGYFIINGNEKIIRQLILPRRNHITALVRPSFQKRGLQYTEYGCSIRCVRPDQTSQSLTLHYLQDGRCVLGFSYRKSQYLVPAIIVLRAMLECTDRQVYDAIVMGDSKNTFVVERVKAMLKEFQTKQLYTQTSCLAYLGNLFKVVLRGVPDTHTDAQTGRAVIDQIFMVHLDKDDLEGKFQVLIAMVRKLFSLASGECAEDNADSAMMQELLVAGHLYGILLKELLQEYLYALPKTIQQDLRIGKMKVDFNDQTYIRKVLTRQLDIGRKMEYFLATGNISSPTGLDLMQVSGFTIVADKLNFFRYVSHFRCVHRGAFFTEMKTTTVRKLLPESWGFVCPVHTPDGSPCGLLNHLSASCKVITGIPNRTLASNTEYALLHELDVSHVIEVLVDTGLEETGGSAHGHIIVMLDGRPLGHVAADEAQHMADELRRVKVCRDDTRVPATLEIGLVLPSSRGQYPGLYLSSQLYRMVRPVWNLKWNAIEHVGPLEQAYMDIAIEPTDIVHGVTTHRELNKTNFLSVIANMTPFSDHNQSPRNMYQCQMAKQTMGFPLHSYQNRADNKLYCLRTPQTPMVRPKAYDQYNFDEYPLGTNAIVAVISYTGYDMEDAMIVNKSSKERGFAHAHVVNTKLIDLADMPTEKGTSFSFGALETDTAVVEQLLDMDGFPSPGTFLKHGDALYSVVNKATGESRTERYKGEPAHVLQVTRSPAVNGFERATIKLSVNRNPIIGDKFASRHGQKGIMSQLWPAADMPFSESGMTPDILFNPHGFPSRMTIGMLVESMAGKSAALHGVAHDATPFTFSDEAPASAYFGEQLVKAGYNFYGHEKFYSGITGEEFECDIFMGVIYYQRLRHMVSDKFQVRTTGPVHNLTHQPIKGRKRAGGIRFGEMERDSLLSHGTSFLLQDRLMHCSDKTTSHVCRRCGLLISPILAPDPESADGGRIRVCQICHTEKGDATENDIVTIEVPYVFRYLLAELLSMSVKISLHVDKGC